MYKGLCLYVEHVLTIWKVFKFSGPGYIWTWISCFTLKKGERERKKLERWNKSNENLGRINQTVKFRWTNKCNNYLMPSIQFVPMLLSWLACGHPSWCDVFLEGLNDSNWNETHPRRKKERKTEEMRKQTKHRFKIEIEMKVFNENWGIILFVKLLFD